MMIGGMQKFNVSKLTSLGYEPILRWGVVNYKNCSVLWTKDTYYGSRNHQPHIFLYSLLCKGVGINRSCILLRWMQELWRTYLGSHRKWSYNSHIGDSIKCLVTKQIWHSLRVCTHPQPLQKTQHLHDRNRLLYINNS